MEKKTNENLPLVPIGFARSALFGVGQSHRVSFKDKVIAIAPHNDAKLTYSGPQLGQQHSMLWQAIMQEAKAQGAIGGDRPFVVASDVLLRAMGGAGNDSDQRARLWGWLKDLTSARLDYSTKYQDYTGPLVFEASRTKPRGLLVIRLNPRIEHLFNNDFVKNDLARKASLGRCSTTLWMHDYVATHLRPPKIDIEMLRQLGNSSLALPQFRQRLKKALVKLQTCKSPLVLTWEIDSQDRLILTKTPTLVSCTGYKDIARLEASSGYQVARRKKADVARVQEQRGRVSL